MKKKIIYALVSASLFIGAYVSFTPEANAGGTCYYDTVGGCDSGGNTQCTSCDPVIITPED